MFWYVLQIIVCSFVLFAMIFQTCYSIYIRYKFWCWLQSHLQQDLTILKLVSWSNSNAIVLDWEVHISGQSNQTQCCHHCNISSKGAVLPFTNLRGFPPCYILRHNMSIVKDLMWSEPCNISAGSKSCLFSWLHWSTANFKRRFWWVYLDGFLMQIPKRILRLLLHIKFLRSFGFYNLNP